MYFRAEKLRATTATAKAKEERLDRARDRQFLRGRLNDVRRLILSHIYREPPSPALRRDRTILLAA